jgi:septin family protein
MIKEPGENLMSHDEAEEEAYPVEVKKREFAKYSEEELRNDLRQQKELESKVKTELWPLKERLERVQREIKNKEEYIDSIHQIAEIIEDELKKREEKTEK